MLLVPVSTVDPFVLLYFLDSLFARVGVLQLLPALVLEQASFLVVKTRLRLLASWIHEAIALHWNIFGVIFRNDVGLRVVVSSQDEVSTRRGAQEVRVLKGIQVWQFLVGVRQVVVDLHRVVRGRLEPWFPYVPKVHERISSWHDLVEVLLNKSCLLDVLAERNILLTLLLELQAGSFSERWSLSGVANMDSSLVGRVQKYCWGFLMELSRCNAIKLVNFARIVKSNEAVSQSLLLEVPDCNFLLVNSDKIFTIVHSLDRDQIFIVNTRKCLEKFHWLFRVLLCRRRNHESVVSFLEAVHTGSGLGEVKLILILNLVELGSLGIANKQWLVVVLVVVQPLNVLDLWRDSLTVQNVRLAPKSLSFREVVKIVAISSLEEDQATSIVTHSHDFPRVVELDLVEGVLLFHFAFIELSQNWIGLQLKSRHMNVRITRRWAALARSCNWSRRIVILNLKTFYFVA